jgi:2-oxoglutarate/2-oxoacid ferredoxin oxidoreductase subunit alpha
VHGGGHGDYRPIVLAPASVQESIDLTVEAFDLAEKYRSVAVVLIDGSIGQMMEPAEMPPMKPLKTVFPDWSTRGAEGRQRRFLSSIYMAPPAEEEANFRIMRRWQTVEANEVRYKTYFIDDAEYIVTGFGSAGRVALSAVRAARAEGIKVGLLRPITVAPFPKQAYQDLSRKVKAMLVVEMNAGQMLDDVLQEVEGRVPVEFYGRMGGIVPFPDEILAEIHRMVKGPLPTQGNPRDRWLDRTAVKN